MSCDLVLQAEGPEITVRRRKKLEGLDKTKFHERFSVKQDKNWNKMYDMLLDYQKKPHVVCIKDRRCPQGTLRLDCQSEEDAQGIFVIPRETNETASSWCLVGPGMPPKQKEKIHHRARKPLG